MAWAEETPSILSEGGVPSVSATPVPPAPTEFEGLACEQAVDATGGEPGGSSGPRRHAPASVQAAPWLAAPAIGLVAALTGAAGVGTGIWTAHRWRRRDPPAAAQEPSAKEPTVESLSHTVRDQPFDPIANYRLAVALHAQGAASDSVRHLDRALRLEPALILHLLNDPEASELRRRPDVHRMLQDHQRELNRKLWSGYA